MPPKKKSIDEEIAAYAQNSRPGRRASLTPVQRAEKNRRNAKAQGMALAILRERHRDEYENILESTKIHNKVNEEL